MKSIDGIITMLIEMYQNEDIFSNADWLNEQDVRRNIESTLKVLSDRRKDNTDISLKYNEFYFDYLNLLITRNLILYTSIEDYLNEYEDHDDLILRLRYFNYTLVSLTNDLLAIMNLTKLGYELQAKIIMRHFIEINDISICILGEEGFVNRYKEIIRIDDDKIKIKPISPGSISKNASRIVKRVSKEVLKNDYYKWVFDLRKQYYSSFSNDVHGHFESIIIGAYSQPIQEKGDFLRPVIGGLVSKNSSNILEDVLLYSMVINPIHLIMIVKDLSIPLITFGGRRDAFCIL